MPGRSKRVPIAVDIKTSFDHLVSANGRRTWNSGLGQPAVAGQDHVIVIHQYRDGLVVSETAYYAAPFQAPAWRARWVEPAPSAASN